MNQLSIDFEPGLVGKYQTAMDAIRAAVYSSTRPMKAIAADMMDRGDVESAGLVPRSGGGRWQTYRVAATARGTAGG